MNVIAISEECADVLPYLILIAERAGLNPVEIAEAKIDVNERKYPVEKARGTVPHSAAREAIFSSFCRPWTSLTMCAPA